MKLALACTLFSTFGMISAAPYWTNPNGRNDGCGHSMTFLGKYTNDRLEFPVTLYCKYGSKVLTVSTR